MTTNNNHLSDSIQFPLSELDRNIADVVLIMSPPPRWSAFNALRHLNRAWHNRSEDPEMAVFRSITAEEEAATALFLSLKRHRYNGAKKVKHRNHIHKNAVIPFIDAVSRLFASMRDSAPPVTLYLDKNETPARLVVQIQVPDQETGELRWALPQPPLNFFMSAKTAKRDSILCDFTEQIKQIATEAGAQSIIEHLHQRANLRNRLLYAASEGYPAVSGDIESAINARVRNVFTILKLYLMIDPYPKQQGFVQQCLDAFLGMLDLVPSNVQFE